MFTVTLIACIAGNPLKAWRDGEPDDVWQDQTYDFDDLDAAKAFIRGLPEQTTTHVKLSADGVVFFDQDAGADHLDDAAPGVPMAHEVDNMPARDDVTPDAPPLLAAQEATN